MKFKAFLLAEKTIVDAGKWVSGKPNKKLLDLSKGKLSLGSQWTWRKIVLEVDGRTFHVIVAFHEGKEEYFAHLAVPVGDDNLVLATVENHGTHPGWHLHVNCGGEAGPNIIGRLRYPGQRRIPRGNGNHRIRRLPISRAAALEPVAVFFRLDLTSTNESLPLWQ